LKSLVWPILIAFFFLFVFAESDLPRPGSAAAPAAVHVSPQYIEGSVPQAATPNIVTAVLADYRGYDTLGETAVILTAGLAVILILPGLPRRREEGETAYDNPIVEGVAKLIVPFIQIFALYVITHGHYGPGGGFQGGVILAASMLMLRLTLGEKVEHRRFSPQAATVTAVVGMLIYFAAGIVPLFGGGEFLDYGQLPIPGLHGPELRYMGIFIVETGVGMVVWGTMVTIFDYLLVREP
jgi:multicomponent Na+:H+ antiporter subunit B